MHSGWTRARARACSSRCVLPRYKNGNELRVCGVGRREGRVPACGAATANRDGNNRDETRADAQWRKRITALINVLCKLNTARARARASERERRGRSIYFASPAAITVVTRIHTRVAGASADYG